MGNYLCIYASSGPFFMIMAYINPLFEAEHMLGKLQELLSSS